MLLLLKNYKFLILFVFITICMSMTSTFVTAAIYIPPSLSRLFTLLCYIPFLLAIGWKVLTDIHSFKHKKPDLLTCLFYVFSFFYAVVTIYRFLSDLEIKENLYYTIVMLGSVACYLLIQSGHIVVGEKELKRNLYGIAVYLVLYRLVFVIVGKHFFDDQPVNTNLLSGSLGLLHRVIPDT